MRWRLVCLLHPLDKIHYAKVNEKYWCIQWFSSHFFKRTSHSCPFSNKWCTLRVTGAEKSYIRLSHHCVSRPVSCTVCLCKKKIMHPFTLHLKFSYYFSSLLGEPLLYFWLLDSNLPSVFFQKRQWLRLECKGFANGSHFSLSLVLMYVFWHVLDFF